MSATISRPGSRAGAISSDDIAEVARGTGVTAAGNFFEFANRFIIVFLLSRSLGTSGYGLYTLTISVATIFTSISVFGLDAAMVRYVAIQLGRKDEAGVRGTLQLGLGISTLLGIAMGGVAFLAAEPISLRVFDEPGLIRPLHLMSAVIPFLTISNVLIGLARGFRRMDIASIGENVVQTLTRLVILGLLSISGFDLLTALVVFGVSDVAASITMVVLINKVFPFRQHPASEVRRDHKAIVGYAFPMWLAGLMSQFRRNIQDVTLAFFGVVADVGVFSLAGRVNLVGGVAYRSVAVAVKPLLAQSHDEGDSQRLGAIYAMGTRWLIAFNLPFFLVMVIYPETILAIFGRDFVAGATALTIISWAELFNAATGVCGSVIDMGGYTRVKLINSVTWIVMLLGLSLLLVPRYAVVGAAVASFIALTTINTVRVIEVWFIDRILPFSIGIWKPLCAAVAAYTVGVALNNVIPHGTHLLTSIWQAATVVATYASLLAVFGVDDDDKLVLHRLSARVGKRISRIRRST